MLTVRWSEVCARRLTRHLLARPAETAPPGPDPTPAQVVRAMCGAHAQVMSAAELSVAIRSETLTRDAVRDALWTERSLVKTYGPRGTLHFLPTADLPMWTGALAAIPPQPASIPDEMRMTPEQAARVVEAVGEALLEADLTLDELDAEVVARAGDWAGDRVMPAFQDWWPRWRQQLGAAAHRGLLCQGPPRGRKVTYANPRRWLPDFHPLDGETAVAQLLRRYLHSFGPATPAQFARWLNAPESWASEVFGGADRLLPVEVAAPKTPERPAHEYAAWADSGDLEFPEARPPVVRLLPYFDAYAVGSHPRELVFPGRAGERALARGQAGNFPVLLVDGVVRGVWKQRRAGRKVAVTVEALGRLTAGQRAGVGEQARRVGEILGVAAELSFGQVRAGPHA